MSKLSPALGTRFTVYSLLYMYFMVNDSLWKSKYSSLSILFQFDSKKNGENNKIVQMKTQNV